MTYKTIVLKKPGAIDWPHTTCQVPFIYYSIKLDYKNIRLPPSSHVDLMDLDRAAHSGSPHPTTPWAWAEGPGSHSDKYWSGAGGGGERPGGCTDVGEDGGQGLQEAGLSGCSPSSLCQSVPTPSLALISPKWHITIGGSLHILPECAESCFAQKGVMGWGGSPLPQGTHFLLSILVEPAWASGGPGLGSSGVCVLNALPFHPKRPTLPVGVRYTQPQSPRGDSLGPCPPSSCPSKFQSTTAAGFQVAGNFQIIFYFICNWLLSF